MNLVGKSREQIVQATKDKNREQLLDVIYDLATFEPMFRPQEIAARRRMSPRHVYDLIKRRVLRVHKPNAHSLLVPLSSIRAWDKQTATYFDEPLNGNADD
jgi:hypothetical protein